MASEPKNDVTITQVSLGLQGECVAPRSATLSFVRPLLEVQDQDK